MPNSNTDYKKWMGVKSDINNGGKTRKINEGDVVWVAVGENVGVEIDGKRVYTRIGKLSNRDYNAIMLGYLKLIVKNMP